MKAIKFEIKGLMNSYKIPIFRTYQKTFLAPPKTTIIGMISNVMRRSERDYYQMLSENKIKVSVIIENIEGRTKDLWGYRTYVSKKQMHGKSVVRRDRLYKSVYSIYLEIEDEKLLDEVYSALISPKSIPSLGQDDEMIDIGKVEIVELATSKQNFINSVFMEDEDKYAVKMIDWNKPVEMPSGETVQTSYEVGYENDRRTSRNPIDFKRQIEYINCEVEFIESKRKIYEYENHRMVFY